MPGVEAHPHAYLLDKTKFVTVQPLRHKAFGKPFGLERLRAERFRP